MRTIRCLVLAALVAVGLPLVLIATPAPAGAAILNVTTTDDEVSANGQTSLREAITTANGTPAADDVVLAAGATYQLDICTPEPNPNNVAGDLDTTFNGGTLTVQGNGATIEQTCAGERILHGNGAMVVQDVTLTGGDHDDGAVWAGSVDVTFEGVDVVDNQGQRLLQGNVAPSYDVAIEGSTFQAATGNRQALTAGADSVTISDSTFRDFDGSAVQSQEAGVTVFVTDSVFIGNGVGNPGAGGAISANGGIDVSGSTFVGNQGSNGAALRAGDGGIDADTSTFFDNHVTSVIGAALFSIDLDANDANNGIELSHVTLWNNTSEPGLDEANVETEGPLTSFASIVGQPTQADSCIVGSGTSTGYSFDSGDGCGFGDEPTDVEGITDLGLTVAPGDDPDEQVLVPGFLSPAVDAIPNGDCVGTIVDQLGQLRPKDGDFDEEAACDVGAVERPLLPVFTDVSAAHPFFEEIGWMGWQQISTGTLPGPTYKPSAAVSRQAMSAFLYRLADASFVPGAPTFSDVPASNPFFIEIEWMNAVEITEGFPGGLFKPTAPVTRQAMAAFMYRFAGSPVGPFPNPGFPDVGAGHPFFQPIAWMAHTGISEGYEDGTFKPGTNVSRQAMSAFMFRFAVVLD